MKCAAGEALQTAKASSPARGMWIEMLYGHPVQFEQIVIPRTGDVD